MSKAQIRSSPTPPARPRRRLVIARRVLLTVVLSHVLFLGSLLAIGWLALGDLLGAPPPEVLRFGQQALDRLLLPGTLAALAGLVLLLPLVIWIVARRLMRPIKQLADGVLALRRGEFGTRVALPGDSEVGELAANLNALSQSLLHSSQNLEAQNQALAQSVQRLEGMRRLAEVLASTLDQDELLRATATSVRREFGYERVGVALIESGMLSFRFSSATEDRAAFTPPAHQPLSERLLAGKAALSTLPQLANDLHASPIRGASPGFPDARAELAVPVLHKGQALGVISVQSAQLEAFGDDDRLLLLLVAPSLAMALTNSGLYRAELLRRQLAEAIYRVSQSIGATITGEQVPSLLLDQMARVLPYDRSAVLLIRERRLELEAERGEPGGWRWQQHEREVSPDPFVLQVLREARPMRLDGTNGNPRSALAAPLMRQGRPVGVVVVERDEPGSYGDDEQQALAALVSQAAVAMENVSLYAEAQERSNQLKVVNELIDDVSSSRNLSGVLQKIVQKIRLFVPCDYASIAHYEASNESFFVETLYDTAAEEELPPTVRYSAAETPWRSVFTTGMPSYSRDLRQGGLPAEQLLGQAGLRSYVVVPISNEEAGLGTLNLGSRKVSAFSEDQIRILTELSRYLATAISNANQRVERERTVTELARAQERLTLTARLNAVGELAGGIAHDFNNLLAGILGNAQVLLFEVHDEEQRELLKVIERAARSGAETVRRLQTFTRVDHDSLVGEVPLHLIARDALDLTRPRWRDLAQKQGRPIEVRRELLPVPSIIGSASALRDVVTNLIINAVDAMPQGGTLSVRTFQLPEPGPELTPDTPLEVLVEVGDTGVGMSPEIQRQIFERFFTTKGKAGTGQGLTEAREKVAEHGGSVSVRSQIGTGSTFTVRLPVRQLHDTELTARGEESADAPMTPCGILVVEDEELVREPLVWLLRRWGHRVSAAICGAEALEQFMPGRFDIIITDLGLPDIPGWEVLGRARERDPQVRTIMLTGWGDDADTANARARGVDQLLIKPFDQSELRTAIVRALR